MSRGISIKFVEHGFMLEHVLDKKRPSSKGCFSINGEIQDYFYSSVDQWKCPDYEAQWDSAFDRLRNGATKDCLVTCVNPPDIAKFIMAYGIWRIDDQFLLQELALPQGALAALNLEQIAQAHLYMREFERSDEEGDEFVFWKCPAADLL